VREHAIFEREGSHLSCEVPVSFSTAALGGTVEVPTLDGEVVLKIPERDPIGRVFRVREKGVQAGARRRRRRPVLPRRGRNPGEP
jgi:molecular chaperone DnaJ